MKRFLVGLAVVGVTGCSSVAAFLSTSATDPSGSWKVTGKPFLFNISKFGSDFSVAIPANTEYTGFGTFDGTTLKLFYSVPDPMGNVSENYVGTYSYGSLSGTHTELGIVASTDSFTAQKAN